MKNLTTIILTLISSQTMAENSASWQQQSEAPLIKQQVQQQQINNELKSSGGTTVTVGSGNSCDFKTGSTKIQDAIDSGASEIRIVNETYLENLVIDERNTRLIGGYANCSDAANDISNNNLATVDGGGNSSVLYITGDTQYYSIDIENIAFTNGRGGDFPSGGGIAVRNAFLSLDLNKVILRDNIGGSGGGLHIFGGDTSVNTTNVQIFGNEASQGGGIYCSGNQNSISMSSFLGLVGVFNNEATSSDGGGVLLTNGCGMTSYASTSEFDGFNNNEAVGNGGGIAVKNGSRLALVGSRHCFFLFGGGIICNGTNEYPINISSNSADSDGDNDGNGGGIYATGADTTVFTTSVNIQGNSAINGGGIAVEDGATLSTTVYSDENCWSPGSCNQIKNNKATAWGGGLFIADSGTTSEVKAAYIQDNRADFGTAAYVLGDAYLAVKASVITGNGDQGNDGYDDKYVFRVQGLSSSTDTNLEIQASTIADNNATTAVLGNNNGELKVLSSIIHDPSTGDVYVGSNAPADYVLCLMAHEITSLPAASFGIAEDNPEFVDRANGDYHLNAMQSPAIDFCDLNQTDGSLTDIDGEPRGWDDPNVGNVNGPYDIGADESYGGDIIFKDNFED